MKLSSIFESISDDPNTPVLSVNVTDNKLNINGKIYKLQVEKSVLGMNTWLDVNVEKVKPVKTKEGKDTYEITASKLGTTVTEIVPYDSILLIKNNLGQKKISLGGKTPKRIVKI